MSPVFTQEFVPDTQSQLSAFAPSQNAQSTGETSRKVRASFTALGLALSLGATGSLISSAEAADSMQLAALPSVTGASGTLPSFGSYRPEGAAATYHTVADGETIWDIANRHGVTVEDIKSANGIGEEQVIQAGQVLKVPALASAVVDAFEPTTVAEEPKKVAVVTPNVTSFESQSTSADDLHLEDAQAELLSLEEYLAAQQETNTAQTSEPTAAVDSAQTEKPMTAVRADEAPAVAFLPQNDPIPSFAEQLELPNKTAVKRVLGETPSLAGMMSHRVGAGESVWSIARRYGVEPELIQQVNNIANPNFIVAGDELAIPALQSRETTAEQDVDRIARRPVVEQQMATIAPLIERPATATPAEVEATATAAPTELAIGSNPQPFEAEATPTAIADPFVEGMLTDVAQATHSQIDIAAATADRYAEVARVAEASTFSRVQAEPAPAIADEAEAVAVNPQFAGEAEESLSEGGVPAFQAEELLAAAPLGSEVYAPVIENPQGRVVSPDMPVLPGKDEYLPEAPNRFDGYIWPAQGVLTSGYGWRWGRMHQGVDIAGPVGTPIYAAGPGVVVKSGWNSGGYGNLVDIRHPDGSLTRYAHNSRLLVNEGQQVRQGQQIAEMGSTGYSTGPHLHFEIHIPSQGTVNPIAMLPGR